MLKNIGPLLGGVAVVLAALTLFFVFSTSPAQAPTGEKVGGQRAGVQEFVDGIKSGSVNSKWVSASLPAGASSVVLYTNRTGHDVYADFGSVDVLTGDTASSTQKAFLFATSSSNTSVPTWADFGTVNEGVRALIGGYTIATSSTALTENSVVAAVNSIGNGAVLIPDGSTLFGYLNQTYATKCTGSVCETATSTNRGYNPVFKARLETYGKTSF